MNASGTNWFLFMSEGPGKMCQIYSILQWGNFKSCLEISKSIAHFESPLGLERCVFSCVGRLVGVWNGLRLCLLTTEFSFHTHLLICILESTLYYDAHVHIQFLSTVCVCQGWLWGVSVWKETRRNGKKILKDLRCHIVSMHLCVCMFVCLTCLSEDHISLYRF